MGSVSVREESRDADSYAIAEDEADDAILCLHPTEDSQKMRLKLIAYVQKLIKRRLSSQVFPYGSVPLRTYLPRGDIDLTVVNKTGQMELALKVQSILEEEKNNEMAQYKVDCILFIDAKVKLVKCNVQGIPIDISCNQLGGLCSLCFLEEIDYAVGRDHLFKRSILLIKSWCFNQICVLGAPCGLLSTYALEIMILYIFQLFGTFIEGPFMALQMFLDYFSKFDWDSFAITLRGPVPKSGLHIPNVLDDLQGYCGESLLFCDKFLTWCMETYSVPRSDIETAMPGFPTKYMNIVDPLQSDNNLGRSVFPENVAVIQNTFLYGARHVGEILLLPRERIAREVKDFLTSNMRKHLPSVCSHLSLSGSGMFLLKKIHQELEGLDTGSGSLTADISGKETGSAEIQEHWYPLLDLAGDHSGNLRNLVHAHLTHGYKVFPMLAPPSMCFYHPTPHSSPLHLKDSPWSARVMSSYVPQSNRCLSDGSSLNDPSSEQLRRNDKVTENHRQGKKIPSHKNDNVLMPIKKERGVGHIAMDGAVSEAGLPIRCPKLRFGSFADSPEESRQQPNSCPNSVEDSIPNTDPESSIIHERSQFLNDEDFPPLKKGDAQRRRHPVSKMSTSIF